MLDIPADRGFGVFDHAGPDNDASKLAKAFKQAAISAYGVAGPEFVRRLIDEQVTGDDVRGLVGEFLSAYACRRAPTVKSIGRRNGSGLIAAAGELAISLGVTPWREGEATAAAAWALAQWIGQRGGTEPAEARQAVEQVRRFIEAHGEYRFEPLDDVDARAVPNRAGWRKGEGPDREWLIPSETWRAEICAGLDRQVRRAHAWRGGHFAARHRWLPTGAQDRGNAEARFRHRSGDLRRGQPMRSDLVAHLRRTMRGEAIAEKGVTGVAGVTGPIGLRLKPQQLRQLRPLRLENGNGERRRN